MISNLFKPRLFYRFWAFALIIFSTLLINSVTYAAPAARSNADSDYRYLHKGDTLSHTAQYYDSLSRPDYVSIVQPFYGLVSSSDLGEDQECHSYHRITRKETLSWIAKHYSVDIHELAELNHLHDLNHIRIGQKLCIPATIPTSSEIVSSSLRQIIIAGEGENLHSAYREELSFEIIQENNHAGASIENISELQGQIPKLILLSKQGKQVLFTETPSANTECIDDVDLTWRDVRYRESVPIMTQIDGTPGVISSTSVNRRNVGRLCEFSSEMSLTDLTNIIQNQPEKESKLEYILTRDNVLYSFGQPDERRTNEFSTENRLAISAPGSKDIQDILVDPEVNPCEDCRQVNACRNQYHSSHWWCCWRGCCNGRDCFSFWWGQS